MGLRPAACPAAARRPGRAALRIGSAARAARRIGLTAALLAACGDEAGPAAFDPVREFDAYWQEFDRTYPYFEHKRIDWDAARATHRPRAAAAGTRDELVQVLRELAAPLRDLHVWFRSPAGATISTFQPTAFRNWDRAAWEAAMRRGDWRPRPTNWGYTTYGDLGYLYFGAWNASQIRIADVDAALDELRDRAALIIDVRMNGGGDDGLALQVAGRFTSARRLVETYQYRSGPRHTDFTSPTQRTLDPRGSWQYTKPVAVLAGRGVFSSNETFVSAMREIPGVTLIGDTTGGATANPREFALGGGWSATVSRWLARTPDGRVIEWQGIPPDVAVPSSAADFARGEDPVLDFALAWARARTGAAAAPGAGAIPAPRAGPAHR
jgi:hypothetical protein